MQGSVDLVVDWLDTGAITARTRLPIPVVTGLNVTALIYALISLTSSHLISTYLMYLAL